MADPIRVVAGDELPSITLTLTDDSTGDAVDLSAGTTGITIAFHAAGDQTTLSTITCAKVSGGTTGIVSFNFTGGVLDVDAGLYEGEVEVSLGGATHTVYDLLKFRVRAQF